MKTIFILIGALAMLTTSCTNSTQTVQDIKPLEAQGLLRNDFAVLVDVREQEEINEGMASGASWMAKSKLDSDPKALDAWLATIPKDKNIILYCRSGNRSGIVAKQIAAKGRKASNMGGFKDWVDAGLPVAKPNQK